MDFLLSLLVIGIHACGLAAALHAILGGRTAEGTVAWTILLILLPYLSLPFYLFLGHRQFHGYLNARRAGEFEINHLSRRVFESLSEFAVDSFFWEPLNQLTCQEATRNNSARLLINGPNTFSTMFQAIEEAHSYVLVQFYLIRADTLGTRLARLLKSASSRGVEIYLLYDAMGSKGLNSDYVENLKRSGIHCMAFNSGQHNRLQINFRNHRKLVVIDGKKGFLGGHNVGDEYMGSNDTDTNWHDAHVELEGPCVMHLQLSFLADWYWITRRIPNLNWISNPSTTFNPESIAVRCLPIATGPSDSYETCSLTFLHLINQAKDRLWIVSPYFVPDQSTVMALQLAVLRGVDVRILVPKKSDNPIVTLAAWTFIQDLIPAGVRFFLFYQGMLHKKVILSDFLYCAIGTANFDNRSFRINFEITAIFESSSFAEKVSSMLLQDLESSEEILASHLKKTNGFWLIARIARLLSPVL